MKRGQWRRRTDRRETDFFSASGMCAEQHSTGRYVDIATVESISQAIACNQICIMSTPHGSVASTLAPLLCSSGDLDCKGSSTRHSKISAYHRRRFYCFDDTLDQTKAQTIVPYAAIEQT